MNRLLSFRLSICTVLGSLAAIAVIFAAIATPAYAQLSKSDIENLKAQGKAEGWTFEVGENSATVYSLDQLCGFKMPDKLPEGIKSAELPAISTASLPSIFDWRTEKNGLPPIRNQGGCGSCWAFATVGAFECALKIKDNKTVDLSEQYLVSCNSDGWGCAGGWWAHDYHKNRPDACGGVGAVTEAKFPYRAADVSCSCPYTHDYKIDGWGYIGQPYTIPSVTEMKEAILLYGPISVAISVNSAFQAYRGGVFNGCANGSINHAIVLVGWDDSQGVWFLRNSWGTGWGESGYMRIPYGCSMVGYNATYIDYKGTMWFNSDSNLAKAPADIQFTAQAMTDVTSWSWNFGDGGTSTVQNPMHHYVQPGTYDVTLVGQTAAGAVTTINRRCVSLYADTLKATNVLAGTSREVKIDVTLHNFLPVSRLVIPFEWVGTAGIALESLSTAGLRTNYMANQLWAHYDEGRATFELSCDNLQNYLAPGEGPVISLYFWVPANASGTATPIALSSYATAFKTYAPTIESDAGTYPPEAVAGAVRVCLAGDVNNNGMGPDLSDLSTMISYLFGGTSTLPAPQTANVDGKGAIDLTDLSRLVSYLLTGGPQLSCGM